MKASPLSSSSPQSNSRNLLPPSIIRKAKGLGFVALGISGPGCPPFFDQFCSWIASGRHGGMAWLGRHMGLRETPGALLDGCQRVITLAYPYSSIKPATEDGLTVARYSEPQKIDYHERLRDLAKGLAQDIREHYPGSKTRVCVDSAPILERSLAYSSGIGFIGKNNMLIIPGHGSYLFLVEILVTALLSGPKTEPIKSQCGTCNLCIDACPTGALERPFSLDASKCLSYLTIEGRDPVDSETGRKMGGCFFGCDICQEVCPFNKGESLKEPLLPSTDEIFGMGAEDFREIFGKTTLARAGLEKLKGNIRAVRSWPRG